ncbi:hypothetical protein BDN72DRAFT_832600 [Pluteus cervinus]|uniref:Uncharacterized protein n=1 Tax=Pluteus cervinus TaxID=181527 RepID=A0ACD3BB60_9AGAR|nr:hypothetical protein BDN72DRAFT_832600 [Pluteus cervinus]
MELSEFRNIAHTHLRAGTLPSQSLLDALCQSLSLFHSQLESLEAKQRGLESIAEQADIDTDPPSDHSPSAHLAEIRQSVLAIQEAVHAYYALFAPIRRLPTDILQTIFLISLPSFTYIPPYRDQVPILFTHVSYLWRRVAASMPQLWSSMEILLPVSPSQGAENMVLHATDLWLRRAASMPLTLCLRGRAASAILLMAKLNAYRSQWQELILHHDDHPSSLLPGEGDTPILEVFELRRHGLHSLDGAQYPEIYSVVNSSCQLRRLVWYVYPLPSMDRWDKLLFLDIGVAVSVAVCANILTSCPLLMEVAFRHLDDSTIHPNPPVLHSELRSFTAYTDLDLETIIPYLTFPKLQELVLTIRNHMNDGDTTDGFEWPRSEISKFFLRSRCSLRTLTLYFPPLTESSLIQCLQDVQDTLEELTLQLLIVPSTIITDHVIDLMMHNEDEHGEENESDGLDSGAGRSLCLCPRLQVLALYNCVACSPGRLAAMVKSRMKASVLPETNPRYVARMRMVECFDVEQDLNLLKELAKEGLALKVYSSETGVQTDWEQAPNDNDQDITSSS